MHILTEQDVSSILRNLTTENANRLLKALTDGLASYYLEQSSKDSERNRIIQPQRIMFQTKEGNTVLTMPVSDTESTVVKLATVPHAGDLAGAVTIYNAVGLLQGVLNAAEITAFRTALATMTILTRWPASEKSNLAVFGSGKQAEWHVRLALLLVPGIQRVTFVNRGRKRLDALEHSVLPALRDSYTETRFETLAQESNEQYSQLLRDTLGEADIICCCTPSTSPLFSAKDLQGDRQPRKRFMSLIGSYKPHMQEIDTQTLNLARQNGEKIWVDLKDACLEESGELIAAGLNSDDLTEIGELFSQEKEERIKLDPERALTLFKCVGFGFMDLVISKALLYMAKDLGKGTIIDAF